MSMQQVICLEHEGVWYYWLPDIYGGTYRSEAGDRVEDLAPHRKRGWFTGTFLAERIARVAPQLPKTIRYDLTDPAVASRRFPTSLTVEEWNERARSRDDDDDPRPESSLYLRVTEPQPDVITYLDGPWVRADGDPPPTDGRTWDARLPYELSRHPALLHLYPGTMTGFRSALEARLRQIPNVDVHTYSGFEVSARIPYDPPQHSWRAASLANGKKSKTRGRQVEEYLTRRQTFHPPNGFVENNRAEAAKAWDEAMAKFVAVVTEMATIRPCATCGGTGVGPHGGAK